MTVIDGKATLLAALARHTRPVGLPELMMQLPDNYAARSVRRWLADLTAEGDVIRTGRKKGTRYQLAHSFPVAAPSPTLQLREPEPIQFGSTARETLALVRRPLFQRKPVTYNRAWFDSYQPGRDHYFSAADIEILAREGQRTSGQEPAGTYARRIYNRLLIDLSYHSSRLEGNTYSLPDTRKLVLEGQETSGKLDEERIMILNHKEAIRYLVDGAPRLDIDYNTLCTLHYLLSDGLVSPAGSGRVRDHGVRVGSSSYIPLESPTVLDRQLRAIADKAAAISEPCEQSLFLLIHVAYLQAFTDVNKRTARLAANLPLIRHNRVPLSFNAVGKDDYASAMIAIYELNDPRPLVELYRTSYLRGCEEYDATAEAVGFDAVRVRYRAQRRRLLGEIVTRLITGPGLQQYIEAQALALPAEDQAAFIEDVQEDLAELAPPRIVGLGVTRDQLARWLARRHTPDKPGPC